jgi:DNA-binding transcriptional LysR family regulator
MLRRLPPLNALKAFEAAARSESFTRAAEELNVTQGAVSHQVKALEEILGVKLFNRERQRLVITEAGREYLAVVRDALDRIAVGTERLVQRQTSGVLTVSTSPDFAAKWLVNRLGRFEKPIPTSTSACLRRSSMSISHARMSILQSGMATAIGPDWTLCAFARSGFSRFARPSSYRGATASGKRRIC